MYVITGATGNTGRQIAENLLVRGEEVRVIGRSAERLQSLVDKGAEAFVGDVLDTEAMTKAFTGATAVFAMIPPNFGAEDFRAYQNQVSNSLATAMENSGVQHVVSLSSIGAHMPDGVGVVNGLHDMEQRFNQLEGVNVLHLRPTFFMENNLMQIDMIKNMGLMGSPQRADLALPMIATKDIAMVAAERLVHRDFSGKSTRELLGPREVTMTEAAQIFGKAIGKEDLNYTQFPYSDAEQAMLGMGMSQSVAAGMNELIRAFNDGTCQPTEDRSVDNTTPTTIEEFADTFAALYNA